MAEPRHGSSPLAEALTKAGDRWTLLVVAWAGNLLVMVRTCDKIAHLMNGRHLWRQMAQMAY